MFSPLNKKTPSTCLDWLGQVDGVFASDGL